LLLDFQLSVQDAAISQGVGVPTCNAVYGTMAPASLITEHRAGKQQQQWKVVSGELVSLSASSNQQASGIRQLFASAFLPVGYPESVTPDYTGMLVRK
jgi:hypothetical protein